MIVQTENNRASDNSSTTVKRFIQHYANLQSVMLSEGALFIVALLYPGRFSVVLGDITNITLYTIQ